MANGQEDLREKNKNNVQGREDAEMLEEKSSRWNAQKAAARREYYENY